MGWLSGETAGCDADLPLRMRELFSAAGNYFLRHGSFQCIVCIPKQPYPQGIPFCRLDCPQNRLKKGESWEGSESTEATPMFLVLILLFECHRAINNKDFVGLARESNHLTSYRHVRSLVQAIR